MVKIADRSDCSEMRVAGEVLALARRAKPTEPGSASHLAHSHVGSYLVAEGGPSSSADERVPSSFAQRLRTFLLHHPDELYLPGIAALTFAIVSGVVLLLTPPTTSLWLVLLAHSGRTVARFAERSADHELPGHAAAAGANSAQAGFLGREFRTIA